MIQKKGTTRRVFIYKNIVIKVSRIYWWNIAKRIKCLFLREIKLMKKGVPSYINEKKKRRKSHKIDLRVWEKTRLRKEKQMQMKVLPGKKYEQYCTVWIYLLGGIMANYYERKFYKQTKNPFVMPTYFSFFGLFNVQKRGEEVNFWESDSLWGYVCTNSQNIDQPFCDNHTLCEPKNFCIDNGKLKLVDYGNRQIAEFLRINGENLYNNFKHPD